MMMNPYPGACLLASLTLCAGMLTTAHAAGDQAKERVWDSKELAAAHAGLPKPVELGNIQVAKAKGPNARTVAEVIGQATELKDKSVTISAKVVKFNGGIMGRNWLHLRDGSGSDTTHDNDVLVTTQELAKAGDVVTVSGVVRVDKDFGSGYAYKVMVEDAKLKP